MGSGRGVGARPRERRGDRGSPSSPWRSPRLATARPADPARVVPPAPWSARDLEHLVWQTHARCDGLRRLLPAGGGRARRRGANARRAGRSGENSARFVFVDAPLW